MIGIFTKGTAMKNKTRDRWAANQPRLLDAPYCPRPARFLQWVGSKRRLLPNLRQALRGRQFAVYCEPFAGSAALAFDLAANGFNGRVILNDIDTDLMAVYAAVRDDCEAVIGWLDEFAAQEWQTYFYLLKAAPTAGDRFYKAARMIALKNGTFMLSGTTPRKDAPTYSRAAIRGAARALSQWEITCGDYAALKPQANWLVYIDPPYVKSPAVQKSYHYDRQSAGATDLAWHKRLRQWLDTLPCDWMASNSSAAETLYKGHIVDRPRVHASLGNRRTMTELLAVSWAGDNRDWLHQAHRLAVRYWLASETHQAARLEAWRKHMAKKPKIGP